MKSMVDLLDFRKHMELWEDSDGFEPDREGPDEVEGSPSSVDNQSSNNCTRNEVLPVREVIAERVIALEGIRDSEFLEEKGVRGSKAS